LYDPIYQLVFAVNLISNGVLSGLFLEVLSASVGNVVISLLWGYLVREILFENFEFGRYFSTSKNRVWYLAFIVTQAAAVVYMLFYFGKVGDTDETNS
jgi:hypothetical protein